MEITFPHRVRMKLLFLPVILSTVTCMTSVVLVAGDFRASAAKVDITPDDNQPLIGYGPRRSEGIHDRLYHRVAVLDDGQTTFVLVSSDLGAVSPNVYDDFAQALEGKTGVGRKNFWWAVTHTHGAPAVGPFVLRKSLRRSSQTEWDPAYANLVRDRLIQAVQQAMDGLAPARVAVGKGMSLANINRRAEEVDGTIKLGLNPNRPVDRQIGLIRLEEENGDPIALIANYAMHGTVLGAVKQINGDAQGVVASYVEAKLGSPMLYINGAAGNVGPIYFFNAHFRNLTKFNVLLGDRILEANRSMQADTRGAFKMHVDSTFVETPLKAGLELPEELSSYYRVSDAGEKLMRIPIRLLRIGRDTVIWAAPLELFTQIAVRIRDLSPFPNTFYFGYTNGYLAYLPIKEAFPEGGYEVGVTIYTEEAEEDLTWGVLMHLHGMSR